jgi:hypothetical protein
VSWQRLECQDALRVAVVACTSDIRVSLAFSIAPDALHNLPLKRLCCRFAQAIGVTSDPRITFPYLLKIRASTLGLCVAPLVPNLGAHRSIRTHQRRCRHQTLVAPAAPSTPTSRDFVHWRFADAGCRRAGAGSSWPASANLHTSRSGRPLDYFVYCAALLSACSGRRVGCGTAEKANTTCR